MQPNGRNTPMPPPAPIPSTKLKNLFPEYTEVLQVCMNVIQKMQQYTVPTSSAKGRTSASGVSFDKATVRKLFEEEVLSNAYIWHGRPSATPTCSMEPPIPLLDVEKLGQTLGGIYDERVSKYTLIESIEPEINTDSLSHYVFVVRERIGMEMLRDVKVVRVAEATLSIERNILFHFLLEFRVTLDTLQGEALSHVSLFINYLDDAEDDVKGTTFYKLDCRYLDDNGQNFGEAGIELPIIKFHGSKKICTLEAFPLSHCPDYEQVYRDLVERGREFRKLVNMGPAGIHYHSRVAMNAAFFREMEPNYSRPHVHDSWENRLPYNNEFLECVGDDLKEIDWLEGSFDQLQIPQDVRESLLALSMSRLDRVSTVPFDDFIKGKGSGLSCLLFGPPGVGKTFTVEATSERFNIPLYSVSAGELIADHGDSGLLDSALDRLFKFETHFSEIVLVDEADVFMEKRSGFNGSNNRLVTVFLRKMEQHTGILFLTTNRPMEFDEAILSRIHLKIKYEDLTTEARREIWNHSLSKACTPSGPPVIQGDDMQRLESMSLSGRDVSFEPQNET
ncbi:hypothetical protein ACJ73_02239 [Blastomyces percursus]|uniref:AAA+ ATPase domain-containing protein n=1 Tax=Blastomyces percursus TaxID=1658174 RepID=A0A1J9QE53_9EURO|nr:hypothetical protein ACJ73_02239 [Blastomyces percursus]